MSEAGEAVPITVHSILQNNCQKVGGFPRFAASTATLALIGSFSNAATPAGAFKKWTALQPTFSTLAPLPSPLTQF